MVDDQLSENSEGVRAHLQITQGIIQRMATNSAACKAYCITLVSAILVIVADKGHPEYGAIAFIPAALFMTLDAYYLGLERMFRVAYYDFIGKVHRREIKREDLYEVKPKGSMIRFVLASVCSFSVWPFYLTLAAMIGAVICLLPEAASVTAPAA